MTFSKTAFTIAFTTTVAISFTILWSAVELQDTYSFRIVASAIMASLVFSIAVGYFSALYMLPIRLLVRMYRSMLTTVAKKAIRANLSHAMMPIECTGILIIDNEVALQVQAGSSDGIEEGNQFNVYESTNNELWGRVVVVNVRSFDCDCVPTDRVNINFWQELERRMRYNTSKPPNVHMVRDLPVIFLMEQVEKLLDAWR